jgi:DNA-binding transcriptional regulator YhcF (GntR family)
LLLQLAFTDDVPIYAQIRNQIVMGIAEGKLRPGDRLPTIRALANEAGISVMTVNKAYAQLKREGQIVADRRSGAMVNPALTREKVLPEKVKNDLKLAISEAKLSGMARRELLELCGNLFDERV